MGDFRLMFETDPQLNNPSWEQIENALSSMVSGRKPFVILDQEDDFVQALGSSDAMVLEWGACRDGVRVLHRLGRRGRVDTDVEFIEGSEGQFVEVRKHEALDLTDALVVFRAFYETLKVPDAYALREISNPMAVVEEPAKTEAPIAFADVRASAWRFASTVVTFVDEKMWSVVEGLFGVS